MYRSPSVGSIYSSFVYNLIFPYMVKYLFQAIDVWMGACTAFVFLALIEFTIVNYLWRRACRIKNNSWWVTKILKDWKICEFQTFSTFNEQKKFQRFGFPACHPRTTLCQRNQIKRTRRRRRFVCCLWKTLR